MWRKNGESEMPDNTPIVDPTIAALQPISTSTATPPDPRKRDYGQPSLRRVDEGIANLQPFNLPPDLGGQAYLDEALASTANAANMLSNSYDLILREATGASDRVMNAFHASVDESTFASLPEAAQKKLLGDTMHKAREAHKAEQAHQEEIFKNVQTLHNDTLDRMERTINGVLAVAPTPAALLSIIPPMDATRVGWMTALATASYAGLKTFATLALTKNDPALRAAVVNEISARQDRKQLVPLSAHDFASRCLGDQFDRLTNARDEIKNMRAIVQAKQLAMMRGFANSTDKIARGLREYELQKSRARISKGAK
jgi:hypothetical protein